jgi:hypothetical protein
VDLFADPCVFVYAGRSDRTCGLIGGVPQGWGTIAARRPDKLMPDTLNLKTGN